MSNFNRKTLEKINKDGESYLLSVDPDPTVRLRLLESLRDAIKQLDTLETNQIAAVVQPSTKLLLTDIFEPRTPELKKITVPLKNYIIICIFENDMREIGMDALLSQGGGLVAFRTDAYIRNGERDFVNFFRFLQENNYTLERFANCLKGQPSLAAWIRTEILPHC